MSYELTPEVMAQQSLVEEAEAINAYNARLSVVVHAALRDIILHNIIEEKKHAADLSYWCQQHIPGFSANKYDYLMKDSLSGQFRHAGSLSTAVIGDVTIAQDSLREEIRAVEAYEFRSNNLSKTDGITPLHVIFRNNMGDENEHAYNLLIWLMENNLRWGNSPLSSEYIIPNSLTAPQVKMVKYELNSFMPKSDWAPWQGPDPYAVGGKIRSTRTSPGASTPREKINIIEGNLPSGFDRSKINKVLAKSDSFPADSYTVTKEYTVWDKDAFDPFWKTQGSVVTKKEQFRVKHIPFEPKVQKNVKASTYNGRFEINARTAATSFVDGPMSVSIFCSPVLSVGGEDYHPRLEQVGAFYKKNVTINEFHNILDDMKDALEGRDPYRYKGLPAPAPEAAKRYEIQETRSSRRTPSTPVKVPGVVSIGSKVHVRADSGADEVFHVVEPKQVDPKTHKISVSSPMGRAVIKAKAGDRVAVYAPGGVYYVKIISVV